MLVVHKLRELLQCMAVLWSCSTLSSWAFVYVQYRLPNILGGVDRIGGCKTNGVYFSGILAMQTLPYVHRQAVEAAKVQERPCSPPPPSLPLLYTLLWMECVYRICPGWNVISQTDPYLLIASFVSHDSPDPPWLPSSDTALWCVSHG